MVKNNRLQRSQDDDYQIYGNYKVYNQDGELLFRTNKNRVDWYISKGLAVYLKEKEVKLTFKTRGLGRKGQAYYLQDMENKCVVCGSTKSLTRHHVVPYCYRRWLPVEMKANNSYDILVLCKGCHTTYESHALELKRYISTFYQAPLHGITSIESSCGSIESKIKSYSKCILRHGDNMPLVRKLHMLAVITDFIGHEPDVDELKKLARIRINKRQTSRAYAHGKMVMERIKIFEDFAIQWREHFVDVMKPMYLPDGWTTTGLAHEK